MKNLRAIFCILVLGSLLPNYSLFGQKTKMCSSVKIAIKENVILPCHDGQWQLVFEDQFDIDALDTTYWQTHYSSPPPADRILFPGGYATGEVSIDQNVFVQDGYLQIMVKEEEYTYRGNMGYDFMNYPELVGDKGSYFEYKNNYTSGIAIGKTAFHAKDFLAIEARIKIPNGVGLWPAFWSYTGPDEVDFFEVYNSGKDKVFETSLHGNWGQHRCGDKAKRPDDDWHVWRAEISPYFVKVYIDGVEQTSFYKYKKGRRSVTDCGELTAGKYRLLNAFPDIENIWFSPYLSIGVQRKDADNKTVTGLPATMLVDWVKIWQGVKP